MSAAAHLKQADSVSREEINARLEASEARTQLAHHGLSSKLDLVLSELQHIKSVVPDLHAHVTKLRDEVKDDYKFTRWTIAGIVIASVGALWVTQANLIAALALVK